MTPTDEIRSVTIDGRTFKLKYARLLRPLSQREYQDLKNSVRKHGVKNPIVVDQHDNVIDGANRALVAEELGLSGLPAHKVLHVSEKEGLELAYDLNAARRHLTPEEREKIRAERKERTAKARAGGMSTRAIAELEGVSKDTVARELDCSGVSSETPEQDQPDAAPEPPPMPKVTGRDRKQYPPKQEPEKRGERAAKAKAAKAEGKTVREIASELGVSVGTVVADVKAEPQPDEVETQAPRWHVPPDAVRPEGRDHAAEIESLCVVVEATAASMRAAGDLAGAAAAFRLCVEAVRASLSACGVRL